MKHNIFATWLKIVVVGTTLVGLACCILLVPYMGKVFEVHYPEFSYWVLPWMIVIYVASIPCFIAMFLSFRIAINIGHDNSFCMQNAKLFKMFSRLALGDSIFFGVASIAYWLMGMNHPGMVLASLLVVFAGLAIYACTAALSYLVEKAANLQEDSDLTI